MDQLLGKHVISSAECTICRFPFHSKASATLLLFFTSFRGSIPCKLGIDPKFSIHPKARAGKLPSTRFDHPQSRKAPADRDIHRVVKDFPAVDISMGLQQRSEITVARSECPVADAGCPGTGSACAGCLFPSFRLLGNYVHLYGLRELITKGTGVC